MAETGQLWSYECVVQWLRLHTRIAGGTGLTLGRRTRISNAEQLSQ